MYCYRVIGQSQKFMSKFSSDYEIIVDGNLVVDNFLKERL
jgi:hypothetical protein